MQYEIEIGGRTRQVHVARSGSRFTVTIDGHAYTVDAARVDGNTLSLLIERVGRIVSREVTIARDAATNQLAVRVEASPSLVGLNGRRRSRAKDETGHADGGPQRLVAPMPGRIVRVLVKKGEPVAARQPVVVVEAMKMENELRAGAAGAVGELHVQEGQSVDAGALLAVIVPA
jgi:biotin carboxyl carrier protein